MAGVRAVILAAGVGNRLGELGRSQPKCLLQFGGKSLLQRNVENLHRVGIHEIVVVVGFRAQDIVDELESLKIVPSPITVMNPDFRRGSVLSLACAKEFLEDGEDVIVMDADVLYDIQIMDRFVSAKGNVFLLNRDIDDTGEGAVKLCIHDGVVVEFRKQVDAQVIFDYAGESVGFFSFDANTAQSLATQCATYAESGFGDQPYEEAIRDVLLQDPSKFSFEDITGLAWIEIDYPDDVERAERDILPRLSESPDVLPERLAESRKSP